MVTAQIATYTSAELLTIIAALGVLVASLGGVVVSIITALKVGQKTDAVGVIADKTLAQTQQLVGQVQEVHALTNGSLTAAQSKIDRALDEITNLKAVIHDLKSEREKTAVATATAIMPAPIDRPRRATDPIPATEVHITSPEVTISNEPSPGPTVTEQPAP